jgi:energy-coupling factor transporter ATP-binding protein EcfA2
MKELQSIEEVGKPRQFQRAQASFKVTSWQEQANSRVGIEVPETVGKRVGLVAGAKVKVTVWGSRAHTMTGFFEDILIAGEGNMLLLTTDHLKRLGYPAELEVRVVEVFTGLSAQETATLEQAIAEFDDEFDEVGHQKKVEKYDEFINWFKEDFLRQRILDNSYELTMKDMEELLSYLDFTASSRKEGYGFFRTGLSRDQWVQMVDEPQRFRETVKFLLLGSAPLPQRINEVMNQERFRLKNFQGRNLIPLTALLLCTSRDAYIHILSMSHKERKLRSLDLLPSLPEGAGLGDRFLAYEKALVGLKERFKLRWDLRKLSLFLYSTPFIEAFEKRISERVEVTPGLSRALWWPVPPTDTNYGGACKRAEKNKACPADGQTKKRCAAGFGCDAAYALRDRVVPVSDDKGLVPLMGEAVFLLSQSGSEKKLQAVLVARERSHHFPLKLDNGDVRYLDTYVKASPDYLIDLTNKAVSWPIESDGKPDGQFGTLSGTQAIAVLRHVEKITQDPRLAVLIRCYQGLEDPGITTERLFRLEDFQSFLQSDAAGRFHFPEKVILNFHTALRTKPFVILTGLSGTGKTKLAQLYAQFMTGQDQAGDRYEVIPVRPDWMDNKGLLGFYNLLTERYQSTPFLDILLRARRNPTRRYYVILDEMNLAKVEYYFSDFLSAMESKEEIELHSLAQDAIKAGADSDVDYVGIPSRVRVPANLYFTGTVNIDETTYMFSPKVLDRANTIEFNRVDLPRYFDLNPFTGLKEQQLLLIKMNQLLAKHELHFGYRVAGEIMRYVRGAMASGMDGKDAFDLQIRQKVLPKFHGSRGKLEDALLDLLSLTTGMTSFREEEGEDELEWIIERLLKSEDGLKGVPYPESAKKVARMVRDLRRDGFVSFA